MLVQIYLQALAFAPAPAAKPQLLSPAVYEGRFNVPEMSTTPGFEKPGWFKMFYDSSKDGWHQRLYKTESAYRNDQPYYFQVIYGSSFYSVKYGNCTAKCAGGANGMNPWGLNFMAKFTNIGTYEYVYGEPDVAYRVKQWVGSFPGYGKNDTGWSLAIFCDADAAGSTCKPRRMVYIDQPQWYTEIKDFTKVTLGEDFTKVTVGGKSPWAVPAECSEKEPPAC